jgi:hypothetical protein
MLYFFHFSADSIRENIREGKTHGWRIQAARSARVNEQTSAPRGECSAGVKSQRTRCAAMKKARLLTGLFQSRQTRRVSEFGR